MRELLFSSVKNFRYERKFYCEGIARERIENMLKLHPAVFTEIYHGRIVNNIYFDSFGMNNYSDTINGANRRLKVRIRWYGDLFGFIESPALELKLKHNLHIGKLSYPLPSFTLNNGFSIDTIRGVFKQSSLSNLLHLHLTLLNLCLLNSYKRKYFLSKDGRYRITVDDNMITHRISNYQNNFLSKSVEHESAIVELKYNKPDDGFADSITNYFPFRMTKISKYTDGISKLHV